MKELKEQVYEVIDKLIERPLSYQHGCSAHAHKSFYVNIYPDHFTDFQLDLIALYFIYIYFFDRNLFSDRDAFYSKILEVYFNPENNFIRYADE